jgi:hypothetical protein
LIVIELFSTASKVRNLAATGRMSMTTNNTINGTVVRVNEKGGYAFVSINPINPTEPTELGDIFLHARVAGNLWNLVVERALVVLEYTTTYNSNAKTEKDRYRMTATKVISVETPPQIKEVNLLTQVIFYDRAKGFGRVACDGLSKDSAHLPESVCQAAGVVPDKGMMIAARIVDEAKGPIVKSFEWGPVVDREYASLLADTKAAEAASQGTLFVIGEQGQGVLKHFLEKKMCGHVIIDGVDVDLFFHANGMEAGLRDKMIAGEIPPGTMLAFTIGENRGRPVALITSVIGAPDASPSTKEVAVPEAAETKVEVAPDAPALKPRRKGKAETPEAAACLNGGGTAIIQALAPAGNA